MKVSWVLRHTRTKEQLNSHILNDTITFLFLQGKIPTWSTLNTDTIAPKFPLHTAQFIRCPLVLVTCVGHFCWWITDQGYLIQRDHWLVLVEDSRAQGTNIQSKSALEWMRLRVSQRFSPKARKLHEKAKILQKVIVRLLEIYLEISTKFQPNEWIKMKWEI